MQVGDRVCVSGTPQCGNCYQCLRGRADMCQFLGRQGPNDLVPIADMRDGTPVYASSHIGGLAELMVTFEEWVVPVFTKASAVELGMVCSCVSVAGLGTATSQTLAAVAPGAIAAIVGCGPLGLSAVQGARIAGASKIIAIDPIKARRELALKVGATARARSERRGRQARRESARDDEHAEQPAVVRRTRLGRTARRQRRGFRDRGRRRRSREAEGRGRARIRPASCRCVRRTRCARRAATSSRRACRRARSRSRPCSSRSAAAPITPARPAGPTRCGTSRASSRCSTPVNTTRSRWRRRVVPIERMLEAYEEVAYRTTVTAIMTFA